jgi:hypothetical protein
MTTLTTITRSFTFIVPFLFIFLPAFGSDYRVVNTSHFTFYFAPQDERLIRPLIEDSEALRKGIVEDLGIEFEEKTRIYLAPSVRQYRELQPYGKAPDWSIGLAYPGLNTIIIQVPRLYRDPSIDLEKIFKHEFTHIALGRAFRGRENVPRWLNEGVSMYESREWSFSRVSAMTRAMLTDSLIPLSEITDSFPHERSKAELAYSESFYLISFLISKYGKENFHRFIKEYSMGKKLEDVLPEVYGIGLRSLEKKWKSSLKLRFSWLPIITSTTALWFLVSIIFIFAYIKKRNAERLKYEEWENEDQEIPTTLH